MNRRLAVMAALAIVAPSLAAQSDVARAAWRRAVAANREGLADSAYADLTRAHQAWPMQPAYTEALVRMAARRGDATMVTSLLERLASQEIGRRVADDSAVRALGGTNADVSRARSALLDRTAAVLGQTHVVGPDTLFFAEGLDVDQRSGSRYLTSLRHRNVLVIARDGSSRWLLAAGAIQHLPVMGVAVDAERELVWLSTGRVAGAGTLAGDSTRASELMAVRPATGEIVRRVQLGDGRGMPGELTVTKSGEVLVSDAIEGFVYRLPPDANNVVVIRYSGLRSPQGIAVSADGTYATIADWSTGLVRWDLATDQMEMVQVPDGVALLGIDGLRRWGASVIAVQNGVYPMRVAQVELSGDGRRVTQVRTIARPAEPAGELTIGAVDGTRFVFVASSQWPFWGDDGARRPNSGALPQVVLESVALPRR